jgi:hypothetical protein
MVTVLMEYIMNSQSISTIQLTTSATSADMLKENTQQSVKYCHVQNCVHTRSSIKLNRNAEADNIPDVASIVG